MTIKYQSNKYTLYINDNSVLMACNQTKMPHSLSNLCITFNDLAFYAATKGLGSEDQAEALKKVILSGDIARLNLITNQNFIAI